jgi:multimeric flavodoxin WrbA
VKLDRFFLKTLLIIWYSRTGASEALAQVCADAASREFGDSLLLAAEASEYGAREHEDKPSRFQVLRVCCDSVRLENLLNAQAFVFICPENLGTMAGAMKEFFDVFYYPAFEKLNGRSYACLVAAGSDGQGAVRQIERIATGWRLKKATPSLIINTSAQSAEQIWARKNLTEGQLKPARDLGQLLAAGLMLGLY